MTQMATRGALAAYHQVGVQSGVEEASPHRLVQMLMEGALEKISAAKGYMDREDFAGKGRYIAWAVSIVGGLRSSLDLEAGGEVADNLDRLYDYMVARLWEANRDNDVALLDEVASLLGELKAGWDEIPEDVREQYARDPERMRQTVNR